MFLKLLLMSFRITSSRFRPTFLDGHDGLAKTRQRASGVIISYSTDNSTNLTPLLVKFLTNSKGHDPTSSVQESVTFSEHHGDVATSLRFGRRW